MEKKLIYIGSPYSHQDPEVIEENYRRVSRLAAKLCSQGHVAFSPITYGHVLLTFEKMPGDWEFWKSFCISFLEKSDELLVYKMPGWENSRGLAAEIEFATEKNIKITWLEYDPYELVPVEEKREFIRSKGYETSWHDDNWIPEGSDLEAMSGRDTNSLYKLLMKNERVL
jgi:hypothetical protein